MDNNSNQQNKVVYDFQSYHTPVTRAMYIGVFLGFVTAIINIAFWSIFINITALGMSAYIINVQTLCFGSILPLVTCGAMYAIFNYYFKGAGTIITSVVFALGIIWLIAVVYNGDYGNTPLHIIQFKQLVITILAIIGIAGTIAFPICFRSKRVENLML